MQRDATHAEIKSLDTAMHRRLILRSGTFVAPFAAARELGAGFGFWLGGPFADDAEAAGCAVMTRDL